MRRNLVYHVAVQSSHVVLKHGLRQSIEEAVHDVQSKSGNDDGQDNNDGETNDTTK